MVALIAKDGLTAIETLEHAGGSYHRPPWLGKEEFLAGLRSGDHNNPLAFLKGCELASWQTARDGYSYPLEAIFDATWELPLEGIYELVINHFTPKLDDRHGGYRPDIEILEAEEKVRITMRVEEYVDFNDIQAIIFPKDSVPTDYRLFDWSEDILDEYHESPKAFTDSVLRQGGEYLEFEHPVSGKTTALFLKVHED